MQIKSFVRGTLRVVWYQDAAEIRLQAYLACGRDLDKSHTNFEKGDTKNSQYRIKKRY